FAEHLFYRRLIESVRWWETGRDPFAPIKALEYSGRAHGDLLRAGAEISARTPAMQGGSAAVREGLAELLLFDLWGNRIDLSHKASAALGTGPSAPDELLVDDRDKILDCLVSGEAGAKSVHVVTDNAGSELTMDLLLADYLAALGITVVFHVKMHPIYVSDATAPDVLSFVQRMAGGEAGPEAQIIGRRLVVAFEAGLIRVLPDLFWNSGRFLGELPPRLTEPFRGASLVIFKGDVNYRRMSKDAIWPATAPFPEVVGSLPAPAAVLRTMKSDTVFGLPEGLSEQLDLADPQWRSNGRRGIIQFFG
ncbi:MAG TPA: ARMT1-like domain-containing protein, partial [Spirochaetia bacterium]|nr:ARMT1-like domain-containing protein [Spirochaetia bacterium]